MDTADSKEDESNYEARYKAQYKVLMDWAHRKMVEGRDSGPKAQSSKMDVGNISPGYDFGYQGWQGKGPQDPLGKGLNLMKGFGKGGFKGGKGGYK